MSWPIGRVSSAIRMSERPGEGLFANGVCVADPEGWMTVVVSDEGEAHSTVRVRVRAEFDERSGTSLFIEGVVVQGKRYRSVYAMIVEGRERLAMRLAECLHGEITRRIGVPRRSAAARLRYSTEPSYETAHLGLK